MEAEYCSAQKSFCKEVYVCRISPLRFNPFTLGDKTYTNSNSKMTFSRVGYTSRHCFQRLEGLAPLLEVTSELPFWDSRLI